MVPFRAGSVYTIGRAISSTTKSEAQPQSSLVGDVTTGPGTPPPMKAVSGKARREVALPSQEGKQGVMQYALTTLDAAT